MRILVTGKNGQIDTCLQQAGDSLGLDVLRIGLPEIDLSRRIDLETAVEAYCPHVIISSAAYTSVDKAETEPDLAQAINGDAPGELARLAASLDIPILHLSTDYVFSGEKDGAYVETDAPSPVSVYGKTKLSGEVQVQKATDNHVILRTSWVYSPFGTNFVKTMLRLGETNREVSVVSDQRGSPTYAPEIASAVLAIAQQVVIDSDPTIRGVFHMTGGGETNWAEFAQAIFEGAEARGRLPVHVNSIRTVDYPTLARRPGNSCLDVGKLDEIYGLRLDPWRDSLGNCLDHLLAKVD